MDKQEHICNHFCEQLEKKYSVNMTKTRIRMNNMYCYQVFTHPLLKLPGRIPIANELLEITCMHPVNPPFKNLSCFAHK